MEILLSGDVEMPAARHGRPKEENRDRLTRLDSRSRDQSGDDRTTVVKKHCREAAYLNIRMHASGCLLRSQSPRHAGR
jgi:hypothetical protein